jgi:hypothetical protein
MKSVKVIQAHKTYDDMWVLNNERSLTPAAGFVIEDSVEDWPSVAIAFADYNFPDANSTLTFHKTFATEHSLMYAYKYTIKRGSKSPTLKILLGDDLNDYFESPPDTIHFKIFKI